MSRGGRNRPKPGDKKWHLEVKCDTCGRKNDGDTIFNTYVNIDACLVPCEYCGGEVGAYAHKL